MAGVPILHPAPAKLPIEIVRPNWLARLLIEGVKACAVDGHHAIADDLWHGERTITEFPIGAPPRLLVLVLPHRLSRLGVERRSSTLVDAGNPGKSEGGIA
jgi:hypothetical protein